ncbi:hypothetical protein C9415_21850 [Kluyvera sp. Nf5]|nr:hypothetical protein C9415_21850 [Kluyvera sp. Nf5]
MTISDYAAIAGVLVSLIGAYYAWRAFSVSVEQSFPRRNAHVKAKAVTPLSKEIIKINHFLAKNIDRKIYLNILFDSSDVDVQRFSRSGNPECSTIVICYEQFGSIKVGESRSHVNSTYLSLTIDGNCDDHLFWETGTYILKGYFSVLGHGMKQGEYGCRLKPLKIN